MQTEHKPSQGVLSDTWASLSAVFWRRVGQAIVTDVGLFLMRRRRLHFDLHADKISYVFDVWIS
jgi:hypothetical protein